MAKSLAQTVKKIALALFYILIYFAFLYLLSQQVEFLEEDAQNYSEVVTILASLASMGVYLVVMYLRDVKVGRYIRFKSITVVDGVLAFMLAIGFRMLTGAYLMWSESVPLIRQSMEHAQGGYQLNTMTTFGVISVIVSVCLVAPFFEEILFRGMVLRELRDVMPNALAVVLQAVLFGLAHSMLAQSVFVTVYAVILGALYLKVRNISVVILAHMLFNISSVLEIRNADMVNQMFVIGLLLTVSSIIMFFCVYRRRKGELATELGGNKNV